MTLQNVLITSNGAWKLAGFGFAIPADQSSGDVASMQAFHYAVSSISTGCLLNFKHCKMKIRETTQLFDDALCQAVEIRKGGQLFLLWNFPLL